MHAQSTGSSQTHFAIPLYFAPTPASDPDAALQALLAGKFRSIRENGSGLKVAVEWTDIKNAPLPTSDSFRYAAKDVPPDKVEPLTKSKRVFGLLFTATGNLRVAMHQACELVDVLATVTAGYPWDDECRLLYSPESWHKTRVETWQGDVPDVRSEINMHAYQNPDLVRVITLGMRKFGCPDLVIDELPSSNSRAAGNTINACAQLLLEGHSPAGGRMTLKLSDIQHAKMRAEALQNPGKGATGEVAVSFRDCPPEEGDPENRLWKIEFPDVAGASQTERELAGFATLFGATDRVVQATRADAMREASARARAAFFANAATYRKGMAPNERLMVKTGFTVPGGHEYMWVEVVGWRENAVEGILANDSYYDKSLREGKRVVVKLDDIYDYIHHKPDGTQEGNETGKVLEAVDAR